MKEKLSTALGALGMILWFALSASLTVIPFIAADLPLWISVIVFVLMWFTEIIGSILTVALYGYATYVVLVSPFTWFSVVYFIFFALYLAFFFIPAIIQIFSKR